MNESSRTHDLSQAKRFASSPRVALVGAGPGDPGLITVRGLDCLRRADVVLYDYLANPQLLEACRPEAARVCLGKHGRDRLMTQDEVNARMIAEAKAGRYVVRLKGGDPSVFARFGEEAAALEAAGISYEVVPGITTALAAGSHAGIPLTDRRTASAVALVAGHEQDDQAESKLDYAGLARFPGTLVFYMGVTAAPRWTRDLIEAGKPATTPAAIVRRCSWPDQAVTVTTLGEAASVMRDAKLRPPVIVVVGDVVDHRTAAWFAERPLAGKRIVVTRPQHQSGAIRARLQDLGADVLLQPTIEIGEPEDWRPVDAALTSLDRFDWVVFSSVNGVEAVMLRLAHLGRDARAFGSAKLAAIGPGTAAALAGFHLRADLVPDEFRAEALAADLADMVRRGSRRFLLIRASRGREVLAEALQTAGAVVTQVVAYRSNDVAAADPEVLALLDADKIDWVTISSSAIARSAVALFGERLHRTKLASISPITSATLIELGYPPAAEATEFTLDGLVEAILLSDGG